jgi:hypothetical protein
MFSEMEMRIARLEEQLERSDKRTTEMTKSLSKLHHFKQNVLDSFELDDLELLGITHTASGMQASTYRPAANINSFTKVF